MTVNENILEGLQTLHDNMELTAAERYDFAIKYAQCKSMDRLAETMSYMMNQMTGYGPVANYLQQVVSSIGGIGPSISSATAQLADTQAKTIICLNQLQELHRLQQRPPGPDPQLQNLPR